MTLDQIAMWCGYAVMVGASSLLFLGFVYLFFDFMNCTIREAAKAARESYWWVRWVRFERIASARKNRGKA